MSKSTTLPKFLIALIIVGVTVYFCQAQRGTPTLKAGNFREVLTLDNAPIKRDSGPLKSYSDVIERIEPAVVKISTAQEVLLRRYRSPYAQDPFLRRFLGIQEDTGTVERRKQPLGLGSGVIVTKDGYIITNHHVIRDATEIKVSLPGREEALDAKVVGTDPENDVAVIKVAGDGLPIATLADSSQVRRGDIVFAVGAPFGYDQSVSMGIVSAIGRREIGQSQQTNYIQTDAAINPGNSGGPLIDAEGRLIGINTAIFSNTGSTAGIGFAIPSNRVIQVASKLLSPKVIGQSGYLGIVPSPMTAEMAKFLKLPDSGGVHVTGINPGSPAEKAGLQIDDVILQLQGRKIENPTQLNDEIAALPAGREVILGIWRSAEHRDITLTLGDSTLAPKNSGKVELADDQESKFGPYGLKLAELTDRLRRQLGYSRSTQGVVVEEIAPNSEAEQVGLAVGDLIIYINRQRIVSPQQAAEAFSKGGDGGSLVHIARGDQFASVLLGGR